MIDSLADGLAFCEEPALYPREVLRSTGDLRAAGKVTDGSLWLGSYSAHWHRGCSHFGPIVSILSFGSFRFTSMSHGRLMCGIQMGEARAEHRHRRLV